MQGVQILVFNKPCLNLLEALGLNIPREKSEAQAARMKRKQHLRGLMGRASSKLMFAFLLRQPISGLKTTGLASSILSCFVLTQHTLIKCFLNAWSGHCVASRRYTKLLSGRASGRRQYENMSYCSDDKVEEKERWGSNAFSVVVRGGVSEHRDKRHLGRKSPSHQRECRAQS